MLTLKCNNNKIDFDKSQKALEKCFTLAAQRMGSMRGVFQGDMQNLASVSKLKKVA